MEQPSTKQSFGLHKLPADKRDYSHHKVFGTLGALQIPLINFTVGDAFKYPVIYGDTLTVIGNRFGSSVDDLMAGNVGIIKDKNKIGSGWVINIPSRPPVFLDQTDLDFCSAFAAVTLNYNLHGIQFDPLYFFAKIKQVRGEWQAYGANLRDAMQAAVSYGALPIANSPYVHHVPQDLQNPHDESRDFLANWNNWPKTLDAIAAKWKDGSFFMVDGPNDAFDNIRSTIYANRTSRRAVEFGLCWRSEWTYAPAGIITDSGYITPSGDGHAISIIGQKIINGVPYLMLQNSWGVNFGDRGIYYFPRSVINKEATAGFGMYTLSKLSGTRASLYTAYNININDGFITKCLKVVSGFIQKIFNHGQ